MSGSDLQRAEAAVARLAPWPDEGELVSAEGLATLRAHPRFRAAAEAHAAAALAYHLTIEDPIRWLLRDLGRAAIYGAILALDAALPSGATVARVTALAALSRGAYSRGRVLAFVHYAQGSGLLTIPPGSEPWTQRRLILRPAFTVHSLETIRYGVAAAAVVDPAAAGALPLLAGEGAIRSVNAEIARLAMTYPEVTGNRDTPVQLFAHREGGMRLLQHLFVRQAPERTQFLEEARFVRADFSRRYGVSRVCVNEILSEAAARGLVSLPEPGRVVFSPGLSADFALFCAIMLQFSRLAARAVVRDHGSPAL